MMHKVVITFETKDDLTKEQLDTIASVVCDMECQLETLSDAQEEYWVDHNCSTVSYTNDLDQKVDDILLTTPESI
jgi:hypothetical protein